MLRVILLVSTISRRMGSAPPSEGLHGLSLSFIAFRNLRRILTTNTVLSASTVLINGRVIVRVGENVRVGDPYWADRLS